MKKNIKKNVKKTVKNYTKKTLKKGGYPYKYLQFPVKQHFQYVYLQPPIQYIDNNSNKIKVLSRGGYGCIINKSIDYIYPDIKPAIISAKYFLPRKDFMREDLDNMYITKISRDEQSTNAEINVNLKLITFYGNKYNDSFLPILKKYAVYTNKQIQALNIHQLSMCLSNISHRGNSIIGEIVYENAGTALLFKFTQNFDYYFNLLIDFFINLKDFHEKGFVHRDITINNILYNEKKKKFI